MHRLFKVVFIILVLAWGAASLRHVQGQRGDGRPRQGADAAATLEIFDTGDKTAPLPSRVEWLARQTVTWAKDYEVEE
ncbi:MAG TPA: hypothetical protein VN256_02625 [Pyrinomonadaceae bacterium]|nr:hypothetical protein [Pyrinomonadaceae bacterium]